MKIHYWVLRVRVFTLIKILTKASKGSVTRLTYLEITKTARCLLKLSQKSEALKFALHKITPRSGVAGPVLHLSEVRNENGGVITIEIYRHICEIRRQIADDLTRMHHKTLASLSLKSMEMLRAWLGLKIADDINPAVYLAHYGRWKYHDTGAPKKHAHILVIPKSCWSTILAENIQKKKLVDRIVIEKDWVRALKSRLLAGKYFAQSLILTIHRDRDDKKASLGDQMKKDLKIMVNYSLGMDPDQRNDIPFIHASDIDLSRLLFYFGYPNYLPSEPEVQWFRDNGISFLADPKIPTDVPGLVKWQGSIGRKRGAAQFSRIYVKLFFSLFFSRKKYSLFLLPKLWEMGMKVAMWQDFFLSNEVGIVVHSLPSAKNFIVNLALSEIGGVAIDVENSIPFDSSTYLNNSPCHVRFVSGPYSVSQIEKPSYSLNIIQCGVINVYPDEMNPNNEGNGTKKEQTVLAVFDEVPSDLFFGSAVERFYRAIFDLVADDGRFSVLIKTKKTHVFEKIQEVKKKWEELAQEGKCVMLDWKQRVSETSVLSDLTVSLPSTAAFESVVSGTPTVIYNPMRSGSSFFYSNAGLNRRIFEDEGAMIAAINKFAREDSTNIGDCRDLRPMIDPFQDGLASRRVGDYLKKCLEGFDSGMHREEILKSANRAYALKWGKEMVDGPKNSTHR